MTHAPTLADWFELAPLYLVREAEERNLRIEGPPQIVAGLEAKGLIDATGNLTGLGRRRLNAFTDAIGLSMAARRAAVRRLAREGRATP